MARASRELAITRLAQHAAQRLLGDDDAEFLENPLAEIDDPPAHDPVNRRDWAALDDRGERGAMRAVQPRRLPWRLAVDQAVRALRVDLTTQSRTTCSPTPPIFAASVRVAPVVNRRKSQQSARVRPVLRPFRRRPQPTRAIIIPKTNCCRHGEPPAIRLGPTNFSRFGNPPSVSLHQRGLVSDEQNQ